jgi:hypothetical protein
LGITGTATGGSAGGVCALAAKLPAVSPMKTTTARTTLRKFMMQHSITGQGEWTCDFRHYSMK